MPGDVVRWLTYQELADALGIGGDSARNLVRRKRWARQSGNDGLARIGVPIEHLEQHTCGGSDAPTNAPADPPTDGDTDGGMVAAMEAHLESLQAEVTRLAALNATGRVDLEREQGRADDLTRELAAVREALAVVTAARDAEAARAGQVDVLNAMLEIERQRLTETRQEADQRLAEARQEADRWRELATAPRGLWGWLKRTS